LSANQKQETESACNGKLKLPGQVGNWFMFVLLGYMQNLQVQLMHAIQQSQICETLRYMKHQ